MTNLVAALQTTRPREKSGSWTSARYDFQRHVAILKIIEMHEQNGDYRIVFDYFDDLVILDNSLTPTKISFFQIKTRSNGPWKRRDMIAQSKTSVPPCSIIAKMYLNAFNFSDSTDMIVFVSNAGFRFKMACGRVTDDEDFLICAVSLSDEERTLLGNTLDADFPPPRDPDCCNILSFERTTLSIHDQRRDVLGRLCEHLAQYNGAEAAPTMALYEALFSEVSKRSGVSHNLASMADFYLRKTVSRQEIVELFNKALAQRLFLTAWPILQQDLEKARYNFFDQIAIQTRCIQYLLDRARGEPIAARFSVRAQQLLVSMQSTLSGCQTVVAAALALKLGLPADGNGEYDELQVVAALMVEAYETPP